MGVMRFRTDPRPAVDWPEVGSAYVVGYDGRVFPTAVELPPVAPSGELHCRRPVSDSGKLNIAWPVEGRGPVMLTTCSLREREKPYLLSVELARGLLGELRNQVALWRMGGMAIPSAFEKAEKEAFAKFSHAACSQDRPEEAGRAAEESLVAGCRAADELLKAYTLQKLANHRTRVRNLPVVLGCRLQEPLQPGPTKLFEGAFSGVSVPLQWRDVESSEGEYGWSASDDLIAWGGSEKLLVHTGPLLDLRPGGMPDWVSQWAHDPLSLQSFVCDFVETAMTRHRGNVKFWTLVTGACTGGAFGFNEEQRLTLVARAFEAARRKDDDSQVFIEIDSPWGEYQARGEHRLAPIQFVDALARSNLGLDGVCLELDLADRRGLARRRTLSDVSRTVDRWSLLGLPIHIRVILPSGGGPAGDPFQESSQMRWASDYLPLLMAKPTVTAVFWGQFSDASEGGVPMTGVLRESGTPKPVYDVFARHHQAQYAR